MVEIVTLFVTKFVTKIVIVSVTRILTKISTAAVECFLKVPVPPLPHHIPCFDDDDAFLGAGGFSANYSCHVVGWLGRLLGWSPPWK